jgi:NADPH:quinone reductase-like Zn-dependent oxidoreductase
VAGGPRTNPWIGPLGDLLGVRLASIGARQKVINFVARVNRPDLVTLQTLVEAGNVQPAVDRYPWTEAREAFRDLAGGHARGKIVIVM